MIIGRGDKGLGGTTGLARAMTPGHIMMALLVMVLWGTNVVAIRAGVMQIPPWFMVTLRLALIALVLVWFVKVPVGHMKQIFLISISFGTLHFGVLFMALQATEAGTAALAIQMAVPFAALLAWLVFREPLGWRRAAGIVCAFAGIVLITGEPKIGGNLIGLAGVLVSALFFAVSAIQIRRLDAVGAVALNAWVAIFAIPQTLALSLLFESGQIDALIAADWAAIAALLYTALVATVIGHGLWFALLPRYETNQMMAFTLLMPFIGLLAAWLVLGEALSWPVLVGGLVSVGGVALVLLYRPRRTV
jgi:O-acetylserine/cysteine efflux transporter